MTTNPPPGPATPYGGGGPAYGSAPVPGSGGYDPYASPEAFGQAPPGGSHPGPGQGPGSPPPSGPRRSRTGVIVGSVALVAVMVGLALVGWFVWPAWGQPSGDTTTETEPTATSTSDPTIDPTSDPTSDPTTNPTSDPTDDDQQQGTATGGEIDADGRMQGPGYSYAAPDGWDLAADSGESDDGTIENGSGSDITVWDLGQSMDYCLADVEALQIWVPGTIEALPDREVDGVPAIGNSLTGDDGDYYELYCVDIDGSAFEISLKTTTADRDTVQPEFVGVLDSWEWA